MEKEGPVRFAYSFVFASGADISIEAHLNPVTLELLKGRTGEPPEWTALSSINCSVCELDATRVKTCPVAANLADLIERFADHHSYEKVTVTATSAERRYIGQTTLQHALSSLTGIYMVTSGCPVLDMLRPMVRFHLPLANLQETTYRATSMYLLAQYVRAQHGLEPDWTMNGLEEIYQKIHRVNIGMARSIRAASRQDASANALVRLDLFTDGVAFSIRDALRDLEYLFRPSYVPGSGIPKS